MTHIITNSPVNALALPDVYTLSLFDTDALSESVRSSRFEHMQLERGDFRAELKRIDLGRLTIDSGYYTRKVIARGDFPPSSIILGCVLDCCEEGHINGYRLRRNDAVIFPKGAELDYLLPAATSWCTIQLPETLLEEAGCAEMGVDRIKVLPGNRLLARLMDDLVNGHTPSSVAGMARPGLSPPPNEEILLDLIRQVLSRYFGDVNVRRPSLCNRMTIMRQFEDKVKERIDTVVRIPELCTELGVSKRTLEYLVKEEIGMTPKQFSNVLRLNEVRRELLKRSTENQTINQIARHFGISHLGRFADAYMGQFDELPSDTLRR